VVNNNHETPGLFARADDDTLIEFTPEKLFLQDGTDAKPRTYLSKLKDVVSVKDFGAVGDGVADDTAAIQAALTAAMGKPVLLPKGKYKITSTLKLVPPAGLFEIAPRLIGEGMHSSIIDTHVANGPAIAIENTTTHNFASNGLLSDFAIIGTTSPANADGIFLHAAYHIKIEGVRVEGLAGRGLHIGCKSAGDADTSAYLRVSQCRFFKNGYGIYAKSDAAGGLPLSIIIIELCALDQNVNGGIALWSIDQIKIQYNTITGCGATGGNGGLFIGSYGLNSRDIELTGNEIGNSNKPWNVKLDGCVNVRSSFNRYVNNATDSNTVASVVMDGVIGYLSEQEMHINSRAVTAYQGLNTNLAITIREPYWAITPSVAGEVKYSFSPGTTRVVIEEQGVTRGRALPYVSEMVTTASFAVDAFAATIHRIVYTGTGNTLTITAPVGAESGRELILRLYNASATWTTLVLSPAFSAINPGVPTLNTTSTARFFYDPNSAQWVQVGAWAINVPA